jgi:hypothetical protein
MPPSAKIVYANKNKITVSAGVTRFELRELASADLTSAEPALQKKQTIFGCT